MYPAVSEFDRRLSDLQAQIDRLGLSLRLLKERQDRLQPVENRLSALAEQCADVVDRSAATGERHAQAVGELERRLSGWSAVEAHVLEDIAARMDSLRRSVEHEWSALRQIHEEPARQLREHAASLTEVSVAAAASALSGFERAEARLAALEAGLHGRLTSLADRVEAAVAELRALGGPRPAEALAFRAPAGPPDNVVHIHAAVRRADEREEPREPPVQTETPLPEVAPQLSNAVGALSERLDTLERAMSDVQTDLEHTAARGRRATRLAWATLALVAAGLGAGGVFGARLARRTDATAARVVDAEQRAETAAQAARQYAAERDEAVRQVAEARAAARSAETIGNVLAAPDLVRYAAVGGVEGTRANAQALWSRSRGLVFSGARLPAPPAGSTYQLWLLTSAAPVGGGVFVPDAAGRFVLAVDPAPQVPRPVTGVSVTIEPAGGSPAPTSPAILGRAE